MINEPNIYQGDQYPLPIRIRIGNELVTDQNIGAIRILIGPIKQEWPDGALYFDNERWHFPLMQRQTLKLPAGTVDLDIQLMKNGEIIGSGTRKMLVGSSRFTDEWDVVL